MKKKSTKKPCPAPRIGFQPIVGATRYTVKEGKKTKVFDVFKKKGENNES